MNRFWAGLPIAVMAAVPLWTETSAAVIVIETVAILLCVTGVLRNLLVAVTTGAVCATIGYAVALWLENTAVNVVGATVFGLALLFLLFELQRMDVWPVEDYGVRNGWTLIHSLPTLIKPKELQVEGERFRPYRSVAAWYCWRAVGLLRKPMILPGQQAITISEVPEKET